MARWRLLIPALLLAALAACGGATTTSNRSLADPTAATAAASAAPASAAAPSAAAAPRASASASASASSAAPSAARSSAPAASALPQPNGPIPPGWQVYRGTPEFPFVVAYPPDWTLDDSLQPEQKVIFLIGPGGEEDGERIDIAFSQTASGVSIDVQRDEFFHQESAFCDAKGIEHTEHRQVSGVAFAILHATCDPGGALSFMQVASGLTFGDEWDILMRTPYERKEARLREVFDPLLATLNIYAQVP